MSQLSNVTYILKTENKAELSKKMVLQTEAFLMRDGDKLKM